jgi:hypothetical protein
MQYKDMTDTEWTDCLKIPRLVELCYVIQPRTEIEKITPSLVFAIPVPVPTGLLIIPWTSKICATQA